MKVVYEAPVGGDGGKAGLYIEGDQVEMKVSYPLAKVLGPVNDVIDAAINKIEAAIPGDWDKAVLEPIRIAAKAELVSLLAE